MTDTSKRIPLYFNSSYLILLFLGIGALFIKNPKIAGIAFSDVAILAGLLLLTTHPLRSIKQRDLLLLLVTGTILVYILAGIYKLPDTFTFIKYYTRILKSALIAILTYYYCNRLSPDLRFKALSFFFHIAVITIICDTIYSLFYYYSSIGEGYGIWKLYSALKSSYIYSDKNMVAFTVSILMILSNRFFDKKYMTLLWVLTILSLSRSGILVNSLLFLYFVGYKFIKPSYLIAVLVALILSVGVVFLLDLQNLFADRLSFSGDLSISGRLGLQKMGLEMWWDKPFTGKGLSGYEQFFMNYYEGGEVNTYPHNLYIYLLAEFGLIGFGLILCLLALLTYFLYWQGLATLGFSYLLFGFFLFNFTEYQFFFIVGMMLAYNNETKKLKNSSYTSIAGA